MTDGERMVWAAAFIKALDYAGVATPEAAANRRAAAMEYADGVLTMLRATSRHLMSDVTRHALGYP